MGKGAKHLDILTLKMLWQIGEWITQILFTIGLVVSVTALTQGGSPSFQPFTEGVLVWPDRGQNYPGPCRDSDI